MHLTPRRLLLLTFALSPLALAAAPTQPTTVAAYDELATTLHKANRSDVSKWPLERNAWQSALNLDPKDKTAIHGLFEFEVLEASYAVTPQTPERLRQAAHALLEMDPDDIRAAAWQHASYLLPSVKKTEDDQRLADQHLTSLVELLKKHPEQSDTAGFAVLGLMQQARSLKLSGDLLAAQTHIDGGINLIDACIAAKPEDPFTLMRAYDAYRAADVVSRKPLGPDAVTTQPALSKYLERLPSLLETARAHVTADNPAAGDVYEASVLTLQGRGDRAAAEAIGKEGMALLPDNQILRLAVAGLLRSDPSRRRDAIALLQKPITDPGGPGAITFHRPEQLKMTTDLELVSALLADYTGAPPEPAARRTIMTEIEAALAGLERDAGANDPLVLRTKAKVALIRGTSEGGVEAVADLEKARALMRRPTGPDAQAATDWDLELLLAHAYALSSQTGLAKTQFWRVIEARPSLVSPRAALARILIAEHDMDLAREQIDAIRKLAPTDPDLPRLQAAVAIAEGAAHDPKEAAQALATMPESTPDEIHSKAAVAMAARQNVEAIRLYERCLKIDPADPATVRALVMLYLGTDRRDDAVKVVDAAIAKSPENLALQVVRADIDHDAEKVKALTLKGIEAIADPLSRELSLYEFYRQQRPLTEAFKHLDAAEKIAPDDARILDLRFTNAVANRRWDEAGKYAEHLAAKNADEANGLIYRYRLHAAQNDLNAAERDANEMLQHFPQYARSWEYLGDVLRSKGQYEQSIAKYSNALERQSSSLDALKGMIGSLQALHRPRDAKRYLEDAARYYPNDAWVHDQQLTWEQLYGDLDAAIAARKTDRDAHPDSFGPSLSYALSYFYATQRVSGGRASTRPADPERARQFAEQARTALEEVATRWPDEKLTYAYIADLAGMLNQFEWGETWLKKLNARESWSESNEPQVMLAEYYVRWHKNEPAIDAYAAALAKGKIADDHQSAATTFLRARGKFDLALATIDRNSTNPGVQQFIAEMLTNSGKTDEALKFIDGLLAKRPTDITLLTARAYALQKARRFDDAIAMCDKAIELAPKSVEAYYYRGLCRLSKNPGQPDAALEDYVHARDLASPANPTQYSFIRQSLANLYVRTGEPERAAQELDAALKIAPRDVQLRFKLIDLYTTRLAEPRWDVAQQLLEEVRGVPELASDPIWRDTEAQMWLSRKEPEKALAVLRVALAQVQKLNDPGRTVTLLHHYMQALLEAGHYVELETEANGLLKNPNLAQKGWWVYEARAVANAKTGNTISAAADYDKALAITASLKDLAASSRITRSMIDQLGKEQTLAHVQKLLADGNLEARRVEMGVYAMAGDYQTAQAKATALAGDVEASTLPAAEKVALYDAAAVVNLYSEHYAEAQALFEKILTIQPDNLNALNNLALIWAENRPQPDLTKAVQYSDKALAIAERADEPLPTVTETRGWVLTLAGRLDEGQPLLQAAADQRASALAHYHLARAALLQERRAEARSELLTAKRLTDPSTTDAALPDPRLAAKIEAALKASP